MEDIRKLLSDHDAHIAPESLAYLLRGLNATLHDLVQEGSPPDSKEQLRYNEMVSSVSFCAELFSVMVAKWSSEQVDACPPAE